MLDLYGFCVGKDISANAPAVTTAGFKVVSAARLPCKLDIYVFWQRRWQGGVN